MEQKVEINRALKVTLSDGRVVGFPTKGTYQMSEEVRAALPKDAIVEELEVPNGAYTNRALISKNEGVGGRVVSASKRKKVSKE